MTPTGRYVAFTSAATNLESPPQTGLKFDAYVRDRVAGTTVRVTRAHDGSIPAGNSNGVQISANGRYVAFAYDEDDLLTADGNNWDDIYRFDRHSGVTELVSVQKSGAAGKRRQSRLRRHQRGRPPRVLHVQRRQPP